MRLFRLAIALATVALAAGPTRPEPTSPSPEPPQHTTKVLGSIPNLTGRWLLVADVTPPGQDVHIPVAVGLEITDSGKAPAVAFRWGGLPQEVQASLDTAVAKPARWQPTTEQIESIRQSWDSLTPERKPIVTTATIISGPDAESESVKADARFTGSLFVLQAAFSFQPGLGYPPSQGITLAAKERTADGYSGQYLDTTYAMAPFPIPINLPGTFTLYRLSAPPQPGGFSRLLDIFRGCGRPAA